MEHSRPVTRVTTGLHVLTYLKNHVSRSVVFLSPKSRHVKVNRKTIIMPVASSSDSSVIKIRPLCQQRTGDRTRRPWHARAHRGLHQMEHSRPVTRVATRLHVRKFLEIHVPPFLPPKSRQAHVNRRTVIMTVTSNLTQSGKGSFLSQGHQHDEVVPAWTPRRTIGRTLR